MCSFFSCIVTRELRILFCESDSHDAVIRRAGIPDNTVDKREFVRLEIIPRENGLWDYTVDEVMTAPEWYYDEARHIERAARILAKTVEVHKAKHESQYLTALQKRDRILAHFDKQEENEIDKIGDSRTIGPLKSSNKIWGIRNEYIEKRRPVYSDFTIIAGLLQRNFIQGLSDLPGYVSK